MIAGKVRSASSIVDKERSNSSKRSIPVLKSELSLDLRGVISANSHTRGVRRSLVLSNSEKKIKSSDFREE